MRRTTDWNDDDGWMMMDLSLGFGC
jgi:hypothetical protein